MSVKTSYAAVLRRRFDPLGPGPYVDLLCSLGATRPAAQWRITHNRPHRSGRQAFRTAHMAGALSWDVLGLPYQPEITLVARPRRGRGGFSLRISCAGVAEIDGDAQHPDLTEFRDWLRRWNRQSGGLLAVLVEAGGESFIRVAYERG